MARAACWPSAMASVAFLRKRQRSSPPANTPGKVRRQVFSRAESALAASSPDPPSPRGKAGWRIGRPPGSPCRRPAWWCCPGTKVGLNRPSASNTDFTVEELDPGDAAVAPDDPLRAERRMERDSLFAGILLVRRAGGHRLPGLQAGDGTPARPLGASACCAQSIATPPPPMTRHAFPRRCVRGPARSRSRCTPRPAPSLPGPASKEPEGRW